MTKEQFKNRMQLIQNFHSEQDTLQVIINKLTDGHSVVIMGEYIVQEIINMIEENLGYKDILTWWLYEDVDKVIWDKNGREYNVRTIDELYDYIARHGDRGGVHVYCTHCKHFRLDDEEIPYCYYEDKCNIKNCEDSMPLIERPYYNL